jgi:hypothetical protein
MACKYVKDFSFDSSQGYTGSTSKPVKMAFGGALLAGKVGQAAQQAARNITPTPAPTPAPRQGGFAGAIKSAANQIAARNAVGNAVQNVKGAAKSMRGFKEGGDIKADLKQDKKMVAESIHKHEKAMHKGEPLTKLKKGGKVVEKATGERYPSKAAMVKHESLETPRMQREELVQKRVVRGPAMAAGRDPRIPMLKCGGSYKK